MGWWLLPSQIAAGLILHSIFLALLKLAGH